MADSNHSWDVSPKEAVRIQRELIHRLETKNRFRKIKSIAGADVAFTRDKKKAIAGIILFDYPSMEERERVYAVAPLKFPYVPGLLTFREGPALQRAFAKLTKHPDLFFFDGQGFAHPRRLGIASHMGILFNCPSIGCAKSRLCGEATNPKSSRGSWTPLKDHGETIGAVLRTRDGVKPLFISTGHRIDLPTAIEWTLKCHDGTRIPKPTREADRWVGQLKKKLR